MKKTFVLATALCGLCSPLLAQTSNYKLFRTPTVSKDRIVFAFGGDLWIVDRSGGDARRLTTGIGQETDPIFSPDGTQVAFTGVYEGNPDVYVVPADGGIPRRMTYHPGGDWTVGWT